MAFQERWELFESVLTGKRIVLTEESGTYHLHVDFLTPGFASLVQNP